MIFLGKKDKKKKKKNKKEDEEDDLDKALADLKIEVNVDDDAAAKKKAKKVKKIIIKKIKYCFQKVKSFTIFLNFLINCIPIKGKKKVKAAGRACFKRRYSCTQ